MSATTLTESLGRLRRRVLALTLGRGAGWGLVAGCGLLVVCAWVDLVLELPGGMRLVADAAGIGLGAGCLLVMLGMAIKITHLGSLARRMDRVAGSRGQILSGWDLHAQPQESHPLGQGLARMAVDRAAQLASGVLPSQAAPIGGLYRAASVVVAMAVVLSIAAILMPRLVRTQWLRFSDPFGDHPPYSPIALRVEPGDARVLYGSGVDIIAAADGGIVDRVDLVLETPGSKQVETLPMFPESDGRWRTTLTNITQPRRYFAVAGRSRSSRYSLGVITVPRLEDVRFQVTPPAYTNRPAYEGLLPQGGLSGLPGTRVQLWARSNRPLSGGSLDVLVGKQHEVVQLAPLADDDRRVRGTFEIRQAGRIAVKVTDTAGQASTDEFASPVTLLSDQRPFIRILQPPAASFATPTAVLPVRISAEDDYGLSRQELFRSLNESRSLPAGLPLNAPPPTRTYETVVLPLARYGLQPGDAIALYGRAEDNDPAGAKGSESPIVTVRIISQEQFEQMLQARQGMEVLQSKYEQAHRRLESLAQQIEKLQKELDPLPPDSPLSEAMREKIRALAAQMRTDADQIREAARYELPYDIDKKLSKHLQDLASSLDQAAKDADSLASQPGLSASGGKAGLAKLAAACKGGGQKFDEQARAPMEHLAKIYPLIEDQALFVELYQRQRALADRLVSLKGVNGQDDPAAKARMRDMEAEQQQLRQQLGDLLEQIDQHTAQLPNDSRLDPLRETASAFVQAVRASGADEAMGKAQAGLAEFNGTQGHAGALDAADILEKFIGKCKGMGEQAGMCLRFQPKLSECLGATVEQLLAEAGLGTGTGEGSGNGYSMRRSSLSNVGLYGSLPGLIGPARTGTGLGEPGVPGQGPGGGFPDQAQSLEVDSLSVSKAAGAADVAVPLQYRQRVGEYFKEIAEEQRQP